MSCLPDTTVPHVDLLFGIRADEVRLPRLEAEVSVGAWFDVGALPRPVTPGPRRLIVRSRRSAFITG